MRGMPRAAASGRTGGARGVARLVLERPPSTFGARLAIIRIARKRGHQRFCGGCLVIHVAAKAVLGPLLYLQVGRLRRTVVELPAASGAREGLAGRGDTRLRLLIAGDSSAAGVGAATQDDALAGRLSQELARRVGGAVAWQLVAAIGARSEDVLHLLMHARVAPADIAVIVVGVNDITKEVPLPLALRKRGEIATLVRTRLGVRHVVFPAVPEMEKFPALPQPLAWYAGRHARRNNAAQAAWAGGQAGVTHVAMDGVMDPALMADDGFHPAAALYAKVAQRLAGHITEVVLRINNKETL
jgi:lysophospholipase L1-like esterase